MDHSDLLNWIASQGEIMIPLGVIVAATGEKFGDVVSLAEELVHRGELQWVGDGRSVALSPLAAGRFGLKPSRKGNGNQWRKKEAADGEPHTRSRKRTMTCFSQLEGANGETQPKWLKNIPDRKTKPPDVQAAWNEYRRNVGRWKPRHIYLDIPPASQIVGTGGQWPLPGQDKGEGAPERESVMAGGETSGKLKVCAACGSILDRQLRKMAVHLRSDTACVACDASGQDAEIPVLKSVKRKAVRKDDGLKGGK
jgi:hypothetical protein